MVRDVVCGLVILGSDVISLTVDVMLRGVAQKAFVLVQSDKFKDLGAMKASSSFIFD